MSYKRKVKRYSNEAILLDYLRDKIDTPFASHNIQTDAVFFARVNYGKFVTAETLARLWRKMRNEYKTDKHNSILWKKGFRVKEQSNFDATNQKYYLVINR